MALGRRVLSVYSLRMVEGIQAGFGRAVAIFLIGLLLFASGAPCTAGAPAPGPSAASFDPCRQKPAPAPECAQIACKTFAIPAEPAAWPLRAVSLTKFHSVVKKAAGRLVRPPLPPPRVSMI